MSLAHTHRTSTGACPKAPRLMLAAWQRLQPLPRAALTSGTLMAVGDIACQLIQNQRRSQPAAALASPTASSSDLDMARTARFALIGLTLHGPFFFKGFQWLDRQFGQAATLRNAVTKALAGQCTLFPTYLPLFVLYSSLLEGCSMAESVERAKQRLPTLLVTGSLYWPLVNTANFALVPPHQRVLALNVFAIGWNAYLSYVSSMPLPTSNK